VYPIVAADWREAAEEVGMIVVEEEHELSFRLYPAVSGRLETKGALTVKTTIKRYPYLSI